MLQHYIAATTHPMYTGEKSLSLRLNFVATRSRTKSNQVEFVQLVAATKLCCRNKDFHNNSPQQTKRFVAAMCHATCRPTCTQGVISCPNVLQQHVT